MAEYTIIDAHAHTYQTREIGLMAKEGNTRTDYGGTVEELLPLMKRYSLSAAVTLGVLPIFNMREAARAKLQADLSPEQRREEEEEIEQRMRERLERRNHWTCEQAKLHPQFIPFMTMDPVMRPAEMRAEIEDKVKKGGARGMKMHPRVGHYRPDDPRLYPAYEMGVKLGLPFLFDSGYFPQEREQFDEPRLFAPVLERFPTLTVVLAHLGMARWQDSLALARRYPNVYFDCCAVVNEYATIGLSDEAFVSVVRQVGVERVIWGSDFPWFDPWESAQALLRLPFSQEEKRLLLAENARRIYKLP